MSLSISRGATLAAVLALAVSAAGCLQPGSDAESPQNADPSAQRQGDGPEQQQPGQYAPQGQQQGPQGPSAAPGQYGPQGPNQYGQPQQYGPPQGPNQYGPPEPNPYGQSGPPPGQYDPSRPPPGYQQQQPGGPPSAPVPGLGGAGNPNDPITIGEQGYLRNEASRVIVELINALPAAQKQRVHDVPLNADPTVGEINAFAACDDQSRPLMAISDGLLQIEANVAAFRATDELFGTHKLDRYLRVVAADYKPGHEIPRPPPGLVEPGQAADGRKVARQHLLFDEQLAFVLGHELAHHYLGHTGCADGRGGSRAGGDQVVRIATRLAGHTPFNQLFEYQADIAGTNNLLTAGSRRQGAKWNEEGAMLTFEFFSYVDRPTAGNILIAPLLSHGRPEYRRGVVQTAANQWRATGGTGFQFPAIPGIFGGG